MTACWDDKPDLLVLSDMGFQTLASGYRAGIVQTGDIVTYFTEGVSVRVFAGGSTIRVSCFFP